MLKLFYLLIVAIVIIIDSACATSYIVFRYDDFAPDASGSRIANSKRRAIWEGEKQVDELFRKYNMPYVNAIIPCPNREYGANVGSDPLSFEEDEEKLHLVLNAIRSGRMEIALHGYSHNNHAKPKHKPGEFRERSYKEQYDDISRGENVLCRSLGLENIDVFIPPIFGWDDNTAKVLYETGFSILASDRYYNYESASQLVNIPYTALLWDIEELISKGGIAEDSIIVVLYHPPQIALLSGVEHLYYGLEKLDSLLNEISKMQEIEVVTFSQLIDKRPDVNYSRFCAANQLWKFRSLWAKLLPSDYLPGKKDGNYYLSEDKYKSLLNIWWFITGAFLFLLAVFGLVLRKCLAKLFKKEYLDVIGTLILVFGVIMTIRICQRGYHPTLIRVIPVVLFMPFTCGCIFSKVMKLRNNNVSGSNSIDTMVKSN